MARQTNWMTMSLALALGGCYQGVGDQGETDGGSGDSGRVEGDGSADGSDGSGGEDDSGESAQGATVLRRLSAAQYRHAVRDVLGLELAQAPGQVETVAGFDNGSESFTISDSIVEQYLAVASELAEASDPQQLSGCDEVAAGEIECLEQLLDGLGRRVFRRPLQDQERSDYLDLFTEIRAEDDYATAVRTLVTRLLISPHFLYHVELGAGPSEDGGSPRLGAYELAARLSFLLWDTTPDDALLDAAAHGELDDQEGVSAHVDRLLADPRARAAAWRFYRQWLKLPALDSLYKAEATYAGVEQIRDDLEQETRLFVDDLVFDADGELGDLLTAPHTFANDVLGELYGLELSGPELRRVELDPAQRSGLLTQPAILATLAKSDKSAPILRGVFVRERLLCAPLPPPPPGEATIPPDAAEAPTTREFFANLTAAAECQGCHAQINPLGFTFEHYDAMGRWRDEENGVPIDASGRADVGDVTGPVDDAIELVADLGASDMVAECFTRHWFRWGYGRYEVEADRDIVLELAAAFDDQERRLLALPRLVALSPAFSRLHFRLTPEEGS